MYTPLDETMLQLGLYDYVWGDNTMLQNYLSRVEAEKNREAQREYNQYLKEYDRAKLAQEEAVRKAQEEKEKDVKRAELLGKLKDPEIGAKEKALYRKQLEALGEGNTKLAAEMERAVQEDLDAKAKAEANESVRQRNAMNIKAKIISEINKAKSDADKQNMLDKFNAEFAKSRSLANEDLKATSMSEIVSVFNDAGVKPEDYANLTQEDANEINAKILGFETQEAANKGAVKGAIASGVADDVKTAREEKKKADELHAQVLAGKKLFGKNKALHDKYYPSK